MEKADNYNYCHSKYYFVCVAFHCTRVLVDFYLKLSFIRDIVHVVDHTII